MSIKILGISASLRNARRGLGNVSLIDDLKAINNEDELNAYLTQEAETHLNNFVDAGRKDNASFDEMYKNLKKLKGDRGLSNSEIALAATLWSAHQLGAEISHLSLSEYFTESKREIDIDALKKQVLEADGFVISTPVYFGDRSSLSQSFINLIRKDKDFKEKLSTKVYAGIAVGAKRNGGQETTLIYQLLDLLNCGILGVGNDSETTSQYGGTGHAGDIGTMPKDTYGLNTSMGTGRRIARVAHMLKAGDNMTLKNEHKITFWLMQDKDGIALNYIKKLVADSGIKNLSASIIDISTKNIYRCLACDICPTHIDVDEVYRCIIKTKADDLDLLHNELINTDAIIPVAYCPVNRDGLITTYQRFMERTRYIRRGDYVLSDVIAAPFIIEEIGSNENLNIRMMTSILRHHTILSKPLIAYVKDGADLNREQIINDFIHLNEKIRRAVKGKLVVYSDGVEHIKYKPVGYILSTAKDQEDEKLKKRKEMIDDRVNKTTLTAKERLKEPSEQPVKC